MVDLLIGLHHIYANRFAVGKRLDNSAQCIGGAAVAPDHATKVLRVNENLKQVAPLGVTFYDRGVFRVVDDALDQVFERNS